MANQGSGSVESGEPKPQRAHIATFWIFACKHMVVCGCQHKIGETAYCWICATDQIITRHEIQELYRP